jgi:hypothetical protein
MNCDRCGIPIERDTAPKVSLMAPQSGSPVTCYQNNFQYCSPCFVTVAAYLEEAKQFGLAHPGWTGQLSQ